MDSAVAEISRSQPVQAAVGHPLSLLILDDSKFDRHRIRRMSREAGIPIFMDEVASIDQMRGMLDEERFDLILIDYRLTDGTGLDALELVRNHPGNAHCPTIMVTGAADRDVAVRAMRLGCSDFLEKSELTAETLRAAVVSAIERSTFGSGGLRRKTVSGEASQTILNQFHTALQPEVAALMREVRMAQATRDKPTFNLHDHLDRMETRTLTLWTVLARLGPKAPH